MIEVLNSLKLTLRLKLKASILISPSKKIENPFDGEEEEEEEIVLTTENGGGQMEEIKIEMFKDDSEIKDPTIDIER